MPSNDNDNQNNNDDNNNMEMMPLYSERCISLLKAAVEYEKEQNKTNQEGNVAVGTIYFPQSSNTAFYNSDQEGSSSGKEEDKEKSDDEEEEEDNDDDEQQESSNDEKEDDSSNTSEQQDDFPATTNEESTTTTNDNNAKANNRRKKKKQNITQQQRQQQQLVKKHVNNLICVSLPIPHNDNNNDNDKMSQSLLNISASLLPPPPSTGHFDDSFSPSNHFLSVVNSNNTQQQPANEEEKDQTKSKTTNNAKNQKYVIVMLLQSGRFAGGVFVFGNNNPQNPHGFGKCVDHRTCTRYTVRKGQGKAQSAMDNSGRRIKSMGSQLRRHGEEQLQEDITKTIQDWTQKSYIGNNSQYLLLSCPKTMRQQIFNILSTTANISKQDARIKKVPLDVGRPTYENVCIVHQVMMTVTLTTKSTTADTATTQPQEQTQQQAQSPKAKEQTQSTEEKPKVTLPLSKLHVAASNGDLQAIQDFFNTNDDETKDDGETNPSDEADKDTQQQRIIDQLAGDDWMTPLHMAAAAASDNANDSETTAASECVYYLLVEQKANPCLVDIRNRVPYFLATNDKVRMAFRTARHVLGEDCWDWNNAAKVGPPMSVDDVTAKKERELEKKRLKRQRQKEKKKLEKQKQDAQKAQEELEQQRKKEEENAKRIRDGLQPKAAGNATFGAATCDFCQKNIPKKKKKDMFFRLDYKYCSNDCVQKHKRELMANAALARFS